MKQHTHYEKKISNDYLIYVILLLLLAIFGFYKNGLSYYFTKQLSLLESLKPLLLAFSGLISGIIVDLINYHKLEKNYLLGFLISIALPYKLSILATSIVILIILFVFDKFKLTLSPLYITPIILMYIVHADFLNKIESSMPIFYKTLDVFLGRSIGGIGITSIILMFICLIILCTRFYYKKEISFITIGIYSLLTLIYSLSKSDSNLFLNLLNSSVIFVSIFYLPFNNYSPIKYNYQIFYAIIAGILIFICTYFINTITGPFIGGFIANILFYLIEILSKNKKLVART